VTAYKNRNTKLWDFVVDVPAANGNRKQARRRGFATKRKAEEAERELLAEATHGTLVDPSRLTVGQYLVDQWLPALEGRGLRPTTLDGYRKVVRAYLVPALGDLRVQALDLAAVERFLSTLAAGRSAKTVRNVHGVLSAALVDARRWKLVNHNAASGAVLPKLERRPPRAWSPAQTFRFLAHVAHDRLAPLWRFLIVTGVRRGEALGLHWSEVDLDAGTATITSTRTIVVGGVAEGPTKTAAGARTIALDETTVAALRSWRSAQKAEYVRLGVRPDHDLVFTAENCRGLWPNRVTARFGELCDELDLPRIGVHGLRHSAATYLIGAGVSPKLVAQRLGHSNPSITLGTYSHVLPGHDQAAVDAYASALAAHDRSATKDVDATP
jgi:integrase